jgi:purine nucleosidase
MEAQVPLWVDCDPGIDDAMALMYLARRRDVQWAGVSAVHGNVPAPRGTANALAILDVVGLNRVPVWMGVNRPLVHEAATAEEIHGANGLGDVAVPEPARAAEPGYAPLALIEAAREHQGELVVLALGPLTNVAAAWLLEPALSRWVRKVVVMGGAVYVGGNTTPAAEFNIWHDPEAAHVVLGAPWEVWLVGLDVTERALLEGAHLAALETADDRAARLSAAMLQPWLARRLARTGRRAVPLHDPLAAALTFHPEWATWESVPVQVDVSADPSRGRTVAVPQASRPLVRVAVKVDPDPFLEDVVRRLSGLNLTGPDRSPPGSGE